MAPEEQFLLLSTIFCYLMLDFYVKTGIRFSLRDKRLFEITEIEITRVDCSVELGIACFHFIMIKSLRYLDTMLCGPLIFYFQHPLLLWNRLMQKAAGQPETSYCCRLAKRTIPQRF